MKRNFALITLFALGFNQATLASQALVGTWKQYKAECKSGAPYQPFTGAFSGSISSIQVNFTETDIKASTAYSLK